MPKRNGVRLCACAADASVVSAPASTAPASRGVILAFIAFLPFVLAPQDARSDPAFHVFLDQAPDSIFDGVETRLALDVQSPRSLDRDVDDVFNPSRPP